MAALPRVGTGSACGQGGDDLLHNALNCWGIARYNLKIWPHFKMSSPLWLMPGQKIFREPNTFNIPEKT